MEINPFLDEWIYYREPMDFAQCIALLEERTLTKRLSKMETIDNIFLLLTGLESQLFHWDVNSRQFCISSGYALKCLNSKPFSTYLKKFLSYGLMYRRMLESSESQYFYGKTFNAYKNTLRLILMEVMAKIIKIRDDFHSKDCKSDRNIRLILLESFLDSDQNDNLLLSLKNLYSIHCDATTEKNNKTLNSKDGEAQLCRFYCRQVLQSTYDHIASPKLRVRTLAYSLFEHSIRPMFIQIQLMLTNFTSLSDLDSNEFLFVSKFLSDEQLYYTSYSPTEMYQFWNDFLFIDPEFLLINLFQFESLKILSEAVKCSFAFRKNQLSYSVKPINILNKFKEKMNYFLKLYSQNEEIFDIDNDFEDEEILKSINEPDMIGLSKHKSKKFKTYKLPSSTVYNMQTIVQDALNNTFDLISRPIVNEFLREFRGRYLKLLHYYCDFFLVQKPQHIVLYMHFLFPNLKDELLLAKRQRSFARLEQILNNIHQSLKDDEQQNFFQPNICHFEEINQKEIDSDWILRSFDLFNYLPSFANDFNIFDINKDEFSKSKFYNFWPLSQLFNPKITDLFNVLFQFLLRLRYFQYLIGNDFLLSSKFRYNDLEKNIYLFRFRLANLIFQFGRQFECRLKELIHRIVQKFYKSTTISEFLQVHQNFLKELEQINQRVIHSDFIQNQFRTIVKFCYSNSTAISLANKLTASHVLNRKMSIWKDINCLDQVKQDDFNF